MYLKTMLEESYVPHADHIRRQRTITLTIQLCACQRRTLKADVATIAMWAHSCHMLISLCTYNCDYQRMCEEKIVSCEAVTRGMANNNTCTSYLLCFIIFMPSWTGWLLLFNDKHHNSSLLVFISVKIVPQDFNNRKCLQIAASFCYEVISLFTRNFMELLK